MKQSINPDAGFTIVEILVAIVVSIIVLATINEATTGYLHLGQRGRYLNITNSYVEGKTEAIRNMGFNTLNLGTTSLTSELPAQLPPSRNATMQVINPSAGIKQVDISVSFNDQGQTTTYSYTTYVGELGVGQ